MLEYTNTLPREAQTALAKTEHYFDGVILWLAHMYDPVTHGFHMATSGKNDPEMEPGLEMTAWGLSFLHGYTDAMKTAPDSFRENLIRFFCERQDPVTGLFIDRQGPANPRETARNQACSLNALRILEAAPPYTHPSAAGASVSAGESHMPPYMESTDSYLDWLRALPWDKNSWTAGDQTQSSQQYIRMLSPDEAEKYRRTALDFLAARQFPHGLWAPEINFNSVSGAFKVGLVYAALGLQLPHYDTVIDTAYACYRMDKTSSPYFVRNPISVLRQISGYSAEAKAKVRAGMLANIDAVTASFGEFLCPDGAFSARKGKSMLSFGGVVGSHEQNEGDIDATLMMLIARKEVYSIFGVTAPPLDTTDFWDWIMGDKPLPTIGAEE